MRLHRIRLQDFRGVEHAEVHFDVHGVTIVEGDNEVGKSCIPEALALVLDALDSSKTKQIKAVQPVHRDAGPEVEAEISTGEYHFVITKRWLQRPSTTLVITSPRREQLTGREAHERVEAMLAETLDAELWRALNIAQGEALDLPSFDVPALGRALDAASGGSISTPHDDTLWERIEAERARYWTPGGRPIATREARRQQLDELAARAAAIRAVIEQTDGDVAEVERLARSLPELDERLAEARAVEAELDDRRRLADQATTALAAAQGRLDAAVAARDVATDRVADREALVAELAEAQRRVEELERTQTSTAPAREAAEARHVEARAAVDAARATRDAAADALRSAERDAAAVRRSDEIEQTTARLDQARAASDRVLAAHALIERVRVTAEALADIERLHLAVVGADAALGAGAATLQIEAVTDTDIVIDDADVELATGETHLQRVPGSVRVDVPGVLRMTVTAGSSALDLVADANDARERYERACREVGAADVHDARSLLAERDLAERDATTARQTLRDALRDATIEELAAGLDALEARAVEHDAQRPSDPSGREAPVRPATAVDAEREVVDANAALDDCNERLAAAQEELDRVVESLTRLQIDAATSESQLDAARSVVARVAGRLVEERERADDERLRAEQSAAVEACDACQREVADASRAVDEADPELLGALIDNATASTKRLLADIDAAKQARTEALTRIAVRGDEGLHQQLDDVLTDLERVQNEHDSIERRAEAARLLHQVAATCRDEIRQRYHEPFRQQIARLGRVLLGDGFEVELDDELRIATRTLDEITLDVTQLSAGAREQLGIISRLACASIVSEQGGAPVLLDDTLGWTDPTRLGAMGAIIAVAGKQCQVIVLTCTPGRYASIGNAEIVRLTKSGARSDDLSASGRHGEHDLGDEVGDALG